LIFIRTDWISKCPNLRHLEIAKGISLYYHAQSIFPRKIVEKIYEQRRKQSYEGYHRSVGDMNEHPFKEGCMVDLDEPPIEETQSQEGHESDDGEID
jgi:hypothetical protein